MKVRLLQAGEASPDAMPARADLEQDLELAYLLDAMGNGDPFVRDECRDVLLAADAMPDVVAHRQDVLEDALRSPAAVAALEDLVMRALHTEREVFSVLSSRRPEPVLHHAVGVLQLLLPLLGELRDWAEREGEAFRSEGFRDLVRTVRTDLAPDYLDELARTVRRLDLHDGMLVSAGLGPSAAVDAQVLRLPRDENRRFLSRTPLKAPTVSFTIPDRDQAGWDARSDLIDRSLNDAANAASQALDHVLGFFRTLRLQLAFYRGAARLHRDLAAIGVTLCRPVVAAGEALAADGLVDACLALRTGRAPVGNDVELGDAPLLVVTGANHGGKSTFLRSLGVAQLMAQAGLFVAARSFRTRCFGRLHTHWAREEDTGLTHGRLDEELDRMSRIADETRPGDLLLSNESFSSTNESEGALIALHVVRAMLRAHVDVRLVTHNITLARALDDDPVPVRFLRAERGEEGRRPYRLEPGAALPTSYGMDLFDRAFGTHLAGAVPSEKEEAVGER